MCGIVGLFLKDKVLEPKLGEMLASMLATMCDRGPDSAGFAVYQSADKGQVKLTIAPPPGTDPQVLATLVGDQIGARIAVEARATHAVLTLPEASLEAAKAAIRHHAPATRIVGAGHAMELFKEVGLPSDVATRFDLAAMSGSHGIGHTRMATESAVTTNGAHPFSTGLDQCLVHNGSLSNHNRLREELRRAGQSFETENDSEVAAGYLTHRLAQGDDLKTALTHALDDLDGFFTLVIGTETGFAVVRDPIACKPAVMAETDQYVAFGSEYRALVDLPGIEQARVWEPEPATVYVWQRAA